MDIPKLVAVIHLPNLKMIALRRSVDILVDYVEREVKVLNEADFDGVLIENFGDAPYTKKVMKPEILGLISLALYIARKSFPRYVGLNILRCSAVEAYRIAYSFGAHFIRVNAFIETLATDSGLIEPSASSLAELKQLMPGVAIFGDVLCKHSGSLDLMTRIFTKLAQSLGNTTLSEVVKESVKEIVIDAVERGGIDAIIITGGRTGEPPLLKFVEFIKKLVDKPVYIGSGVTPQNISEYIKYCDGVIVGSYIKKDGKAGNPTDPERAKKLVEVFRRSALR